MIGLNFKPPNLRQYPGKEKVKTCTFPIPYPQAGLAVLRRFFNPEFKIGKVAGVFVVQIDVKRRFQLNRDLYGYIIPPSSFIGYFRGFVAQVFFPEFPFVISPADNHKKPFEIGILFLIT